MNNQSRSLSLEEAATFDRLVDGELTEAERREVLGNLDRANDGWRRCALAFLEAQAWGAEFKRMGRESKDAETHPVAMLTAAGSTAGPTSGAAAPTIATQVPVHPRRFLTALFSPVGTALSMAASFLIALSIGLWWHDDPTGQSPVNSGRSNQIAESRPAPAKSTRPADPKGPPDTQFVDHSVQEPYAVVENPNPNNDSEVIPPEVLRSLRRLGYRVEQQQRYVPVQTEAGGPTMYVPINQLEFRYVGDPYQ